MAGNTPVSSEEESDDAQNDDIAIINATDDPPRSQPTSSRKGNVCDLTLSTPTTPSSDEDDDIVILESVVRPRSSYNPTISTPTITSNHSSPHNRNLEDVVYHETAHFEKYTVDGIGGRLLRKAGWNGDKTTLYERNGPIEQSTKYRNSTMRQRSGLGFDSTFNPSPCYKSRGGQYSDGTPKRKRVKYGVFRPPPMSSISTLPQRVRIPPLVAQCNQSNTRNTAISLLDDDDSDCMETANGLHGRNGLNSVNRPNPGTLRSMMDLNGSGSGSKRRRNAKRKRAAVEVVDVDDDDVVMVPKGEVVQRRIERIPFDDIVRGLAVDSEESTRRWIAREFSKRRKIAVTKMVISVKDSYSQCRIAVPVRGRQCPHLQPFDARSFLLRPAKYQKCTQCNRRVGTGDLVKMAYFERIFDDLKVNHAEIAQIEISRDGSWTPVVDKERKGGRSRNCNVAVQREVVGIEDSDNEEGDGGDVEGHSVQSGSDGDGIENGDKGQSVIVLSSSDEGEGENGNVMSNQDGNVMSKQDEDVDELLNAILISQEMNGTCAEKDLLNGSKSIQKTGSTDLSVVDLLDSSSDGE